MSNEELIIEVTNNKKDIQSLKERMTKVEENANVMIELCKNVEKMAINMEHMAQEQKEIKERVTKIENEPAEEYRHIRRTIITSIVTAIVGAILGALIALILK